MRSFVFGLLVGVGIGAGGMYATIAWPFGGKSSAASVTGAGADAGPESGDDGARRKKRRRGKRGRKRADQGQIGDIIPELSAADRKLVWRGPAVTLPEKEVDFATGGDGRSLNQSEINSGIASGRDDVISCIKEARGNAQLRATITLKFLVDSDGDVSKSRVHAPKYLFDQGFGECATRAIRGMRFPGTGAATVVTVPFDLS